MVKRGVFCLIEPMFELKNGLEDDIIYLNSCNQLTRNNKDEGFR